MPSNLDEIKYRSGDLPKPEVNPEHLRVYGHMLCPFVQRAYIALSCKDIPFQKVFVDLDNKAQWHKDFNGGLVPILESPSGCMVNESGVIMDFAEEFAKPGQGIPLRPNEGKPGDVESNMKTAKMRLNMQKFDGIFHKSFWGTFLNRF